MTLQVAQSAPDFSMEDHLGNRVSLSNLRGKKVMLSFYRYASCPLCNLRVHELIKLHEEFSRKGLTMVAFFHSPRETILEYVGKQGPPFLIIPDPERKVFDLYGIEESEEKYNKGAANKDRIEAAHALGFESGKKVDGSRYVVPADFLIDEQGIIRTAYYGADISDHLPIEDIEKFLE